MNINVGPRRFYLALLLLGLVVGWLSVTRPVDAASNAALTLGTTEVSEGVDYATQELGLPWWNFNGEPYPDKFTALKNINANTFKITPQGFYDMTSVNSDPSIWLSFTGIENTQKTLKMGDNYPIDATKYKLLSYYMCLDNAPSATDFGWGALVYWMYDRSPHDDPANGHTNYLLFVNQGRFQNDGDCELITFDLSQPSGWNVGSWNNSPNKPPGLRLDPINVAGASYQIGWVRLTTKDTTNIVPISWTGAPSGTQEFYVSLTGCGQDGILIGTKTGSSGTFNWGSTVINGFSAVHPLPLPESFEPGSYFIYMIDAGGAVACAGNNPLKVHTAPILDFQKPSFLSGPDFASIKLNDPWGMSNSEDIEKFVSVDNESFNNGILFIEALNNDPRLYLNLNGQKIPTSQYHYASFRFRILGTNSATSDWVQRWIWWYDAGPAASSITTQDMVIYENWHTYSIDLNKAPMENCSSNCWSGTPKVLRFDPFETPKPTHIEIDYFTLTGDEKIAQGTNFQIYYTTTAAQNSTIRFYYDTDKNPNNGRTLIGQVSQGAPVQMQDLDFPVFKNYFPILWNSDRSELGLYALSSLYNWNTSGVPKATYYISAEIDDGVMITNWYSELPVTIQ